jgi:hypothetical protein
LPDLAADQGEEGEGEERVHAGRVRIARQSSGKTIMAMVSDTRYYVARFKTDLTLDTSFSTSGIGGANKDLIYAGNGNDSVRGYGGNDQIFGQGGDDSLWGTAGHDRLDGGDGNDSLWGNGRFQSPFRRRRRRYVAGREFHPRHPRRRRGRQPRRLRRSAGHVD